MAAVAGGSGTGNLPWNMVSVKEEPEEVAQTHAQQPAQILAENEIKEEEEAANGPLTAGQPCLGELHYVNKLPVAAIPGPDIKPAVTGHSLLSFTPFKTEDDNEEPSQDLSYLDDNRLCMSPQDHEIDPEAEATNAQRKKPPTGPLSIKFRSFKRPSVFTVLGKNKVQSVIIKKKRKPGSVADVKDCFVELCKKLDCGIDCKCFGKASHNIKKNVVKSAVSAGVQTPQKATSVVTSRRQMDGKRQMKMSEKLRAFYEERHRNRLAQSKKGNPGTELLAFRIITSSSLATPMVTSPVVKSPAVKSPSVKSPSVKSPSVRSPSAKSPLANRLSIKSPSVNIPNLSVFKPHKLGLPKGRIRKSRRLDESIYCPICNKEFHYAFSLRRHVKGHTLKGEASAPPVLERENLVQVESLNDNDGVVHIEPLDEEEEEEEEEEPPQLDPQVPQTSSYENIRALLTSPAATPAPQKRIRVVLNVPKLDFNRRQKAISKPKIKTMPEPSGVPRGVQLLPIGEGKTAINIAPISEEEASKLDAGAAMVHPDLTSVIHPSCNPVVVIAPIEEMSIPPVVEITPEGSTEVPLTMGSPIPLLSNQPSTTKPNNKIISTLDKASSEIFNILSQAEGPTRRVIEVSPTDEDEDASDPLNDSGVTEGDVGELSFNTTDHDDENQGPATKSPRRMGKKKGSSISLGLASASRMKNAKMRNRRKMIRESLSKNMKAVVNAKVVKKQSPSTMIHPADGEDNAERRPKRKASFLALKQIKDMEEEDEGEEESGQGKVKRQRTDSDSGIETESDGSDRAKKSPMAKPKVILSLSMGGETTMTSSEERDTIHLMSGEPISRDELHARIDNQIAKRTQAEPIICPICDKKFSYPSEIRRHIMMHTNEREFKCTLCDRAFARRPHLNEHMRVHTGERPFKCKSCPAAFAQKSNLIIHNRTHTGARPFACSECGKRFRRQDAQTQHLLTHHSNVKPYTCAECGAAFPCLRYLKDHMKCHSKERPFKCSQCDAAFVCNKYLKLHIRALHTNVRPYKCDMCPAKFTQSGKLVEHQRIHTGERPYSCSSCGAAFVRSGHLRRHLLTHTGERPYACTDCPAKFSQKDHLKRHVKSMHQ